MPFASKLFFICNSFILVPCSRLMGAWCQSAPATPSTAQGHFTYHWSCRIQNGWLLSFFFFSHLMHCQVNRYYSVMCYCSLMQWEDLSKQLWTRSIGLSKFKIWSEFASSSFKTAAIWMCLCLFFFKNSASSENVEPKGSSSTLDESESPSPQLQHGEKISQVSW